MKDFIQSKIRLKNSYCSLFNCRSQSLACKQDCKNMSNSTGADPGFLVTIAQIFRDRNHALLACGTRPLYGQMINHVCL